MQSPLAIRFPSFLRRKNGMNMRPGMESGQAITGATYLSVWQTKDGLSD